MNILDGAEGLLPELKLDRCVELSEAGVEVVLKRFGIVEVDGVDLVGILGDVGEVEAEGLAQAAELDFSLVLQAETEGLLGW